MRHQVAGKKLGRSSSHRRALFRNLIAALVEHGRIKTTHAKALVVRRLAEKLVTLSKRGLNAKRAGANARALAYRRLVSRTLKDDVVLAKFFDVYGRRFEKRNGGYTRVVKLGHRAGDAAPVSLVEFLPEDRAVEPPKKGKGKGRQAKAKIEAAGSGAPEDTVAGE